MAGASTDEDTNGSSGASLDGLSAHSNAVLSHRGFHRAIELQRSRNFTALQVTKVLLSGLSRELQVLFFLFERALVVLGLLDLIVSIDLVGHVAHGHGSQREGLGSSHTACAWGALARPLQQLLGQKHWSHYYKQTINYTISFLLTCRDS